MSNYPRGSEWRKWDLHTHTPLTKLNDKYSTAKGGDVWTDFCERVERSDVEVFGITDYFSVENYLLFKKNFQNKYPKSKKVFFANVELRVDRSSNNRNEGYDLHLIFDNELADSKLEEFLRNLKLDNTDGSGKKIKASELKTENDFKSAFTTIPFITDALKDTFGDEKPYFVALMAHGHGGVQPEKDNSRKNAVAEETDKRVADIYFGCDGKDREFFLNDRGKVKKKKPCISGSDAHSFKDFDDKVGKKFLNDGTRHTLPTWIKADKTFEGLRQIIHEPQERVFFGDKPDKLLSVESDRSRFMDSIKVSHINSTQTFGWFNDEIPLNSGLVAVIGRKGQGKSALTDIIGLCGRTKIAPKDYSFLHKDKFRKNKAGLAKDYEATLTWLDGTPITENLDSDVNATEVEKIKYLPQKYVETICNEDGVSSQFQKEIDKVIFSYIPEESRLNTTNLGDLISVKTSTIDGKVVQIKTDLHSANEHIVKLESKRRPQYLESLKNKLEGKRQELKSLVKPSVIAAPKSKLKTGDQKKLTKLTSQIEAISKKIETAKDSLRTVNDNLHKVGKLKAAVSRVAEDAATIAKDFADDAKHLSIDLSKLFSVKVDNTILDRTERKLSNEKENLEELLDQSEVPLPKSLYAKKSGLEAQKEKMVNTLGEDQKKYSAYQGKLKEYNTRRKEIEGKPNDLTLETIKSIETEIKYLAKKVYADLKRVLGERTSLVSKLYSELQQKSDFYKEIYRPLQRFIEAEKKTQEKSGSKLGFDAGIVFDKGSFPTRFLGYINQNRDGSFQYTDKGQKVLSKITEKADFSDLAGAKKFTQELIEHLEHDKTKNPETENVLYSQLKGGEQENIEFYDYTFGLEYLNVKYKVLFNGKDLNSNEFSPGEKGALLLIFYLLIDKDRIPLIMDQPEENLDNESIFEILVPYIRKAKMKRQIIIVTHNPNLAIVCDAEQIVAASMKKQKSQIRYAFGSIENPEMNKKASDVLEGTLPAFDIRDEKYIRK
ncbi:hypothetical protein A3I28_03060 [Candidatus Giovannonibacteria bacterium RIFCSPLOWO2_02_FULL_43_37]|uniref:ATPase AAA-type core domain-containing protein n=2 Tax=Parcubacteria group TaxID=1794811 RepID=A0A1G2T6I9_9BACT|nr:MAG: hypothetical protein A3I28_03060 [Candidatus Giovannonibacteria bacterium RIFCSPLOWO2_02_FULL_43_37]OGF92687.1 MAG: hypothetical protein A3H05_03895 [Candidatus Giovannonibacteria bacterium RIFCSPLOWO2_12_FULL_43_26]OHA92638.1 MAG: hypothetical protein A2W58_00605 [Candidatus Zambryskibacteria bacterium RIFCSPHIGHO2_02_38_10.5]OHA95284.1 MAG: hypothetical protein A3C63_01635 [Candidatus Zambryskibacteria bacterium RIFCSPHIGHO2_02_FULL_39_82]OHB08954.1 MAG: hypothetical protein A2W64_029